MKDTIVLAYSGGLDTSVALRWLADEYSADVIALLVDVGQPIDVEHVTERAHKAGAAEVVVIDAKQEFSEQYVLPILQAGALYEGRYPLVSALSRPLIAKHLVAVAREHGADGRRPRLHRQGQRPGAVRDGGVGARARPGRAGTGARLGHDAGAGDRLRPASTRSRCPSSRARRTPSTRTCGGGRSRRARSRIPGRRRRRRRSA